LAGPPELRAWPETEYRIRDPIIGLAACEARSDTYVNPRDDQRKVILMFGSKTYGSNAWELDVSNPREGVTKPCQRQRGYGPARSAAAALALALAGVSTASAAPPPNPTQSDKGANTAGGSGALLKLTTGTANTAFGFSALGENRGGVLNTAVGFNALATNTTGNFNAAFGASALIVNTSGVDNTASGAFALFKNTTGKENTAHGSRALAANTFGDFNTASGSRALSANEVGEANTAIGAQALSANTNGNFNVAIGRFALEKNISGTENIALGASAGSGVINGRHNIHIGNSGIDESDTIRIGFLQKKTFVAGIRGRATSLADAVSVVIDSKGQLGTVNSSARFKEDIHDMAGYSRGLYDLRPVTYRYKEPVADGTKPLEPGLIAEEVEKVFPDLVAYGADGQVETVQYHKLTPMLLNELQRQAERNTDLETEIRDLKAHLVEARAEVRHSHDVLAEQNARLADQLAKLERASITFAAHRVVMD
jgi:hypothetical protein